MAHEAGPLLITAGAGSGKTRVIIHRIAHLIAGGAPPHSILALTFTNKAADEMRERAAALIGQSARHATLSTFHSFCYHTLLRHGNLVGLQPGFTVYDDSDQKSLIKACIKDLNLHDTANLDPARVHNMISFAKNFRQPAQVSEFDALAKHLNAISGAYEAALLRHNAVDFDNLILKTLTCWSSSRMCWPECANAIFTFWWMNIRTPTTCSSCCCGCWPGRGAA